MTIKEVENVTGLTAKSIRYYEDKGLIVVERDEDIIVGGGNNIFVVKVEGKTLNKIVTVNLLEAKHKDLEFIKKYNTQSRPEVMKLLDKYSYKKILMFNNRNEANNFLRQI